MKLNSSIKEIMVTFSLSLSTDSWVSPYIYTMITYKHSSRFRIGFDSFGKRICELDRLGMVHADVSNWRSLGLAAGDVPGLHAGRSDVDHAEENAGRLLVCTRFFFFFFRLLKSSPSETTNVSVFSANLSTESSAGSCITTFFLFFFSSCKSLIFLYCLLIIFRRV